MPPETIWLEVGISLVGSLIPHLLVPLVISLCQSFTLCFGHLLVLPIPSAVISSRPPQRGPDSFWESFPEVGQAGGSRGRGWGGAGRTQKGNKGAHKGQKVQEVPEI